MRIVYVGYDYNVYNYDELSREAKDYAIKHEREAGVDIRNDIFYEDIIEQLRIDYPHSNLNVEYSLNYCQGDGLNVYGDLDLMDFIGSCDFPESEKTELKNYIEWNTNIYRFTFRKNGHYGYSCKFMDEKYIDDEIEEFIDGLEVATEEHYLEINRELIEKMYHSIIDTFEALDKGYEKDGYSYIYGEDIDDEYMSDMSDANGWEYLEDGSLA